MRCLKQSNSLTEISTGPAESITQRANVNPPTVEISPPSTCDVSIIIPVGPGDDSWRALIEDLSFVPFSTEVLCVGTTSESVPKMDANEIKSTLTAPEAMISIEWIDAPRGRARQMNVGAQHATGRFLWFLHADSRINRHGFEALQRSLTAAPAALHYFNLAFLDDGPRWMKLNTWGCWIRSHLLGMPFGDQGLCLARETFQKLGGFDEAAPYGEDHLLVWMARRRQIRLRCTGTILRTSARKYRERGWLRTTFRHVRLTFAQAWPQFWLWLLGR